MPKTPIPEDPRSTKQILAGIQLILGEIRDLKLEGAEDRKRGDEDRKRADEDRKQYAEDRRLYEEDRKRSDQRFERMFEAFAAREKDLTEVIVTVGKIGKKILQTQAVHTTLLQQSIGLLRQIAHGLNGRGNGRARGNGNGHSG